MANRLVDAFARYGAKPQNRLRGRSAIAEDGSLVLSCFIPQFRRADAGVLRYEDALSRDSGDRASALLLREHLVLARDGQLRIRMVVVAEAREGRTRFKIYARPDVIGHLIEFDGDHFTVDFMRPEIELEQPEVDLRRRS